MSTAAATASRPPISSYTVAISRAPDRGMRRASQRRAAGATWRTGQSGVRATPRRGLRRVRVLDRCGSRGDCGDMHSDPLRRAAELSAAYLEELPQRPVAARASLEDLRAALGVELGEEGVDPATVVEELAEAADGGIVASGGPRYFGFVVGGAMPAAIAADWMTSAWDQN